MTARQEFTAADFERRRARKEWDKPRPRGKIPPLTDEMLDDLEWLRDWLTVALRPRAGWRVFDFERGDDFDGPCTLVAVNGSDRRRWRFRSQKDFTSKARLRPALSHVAGSDLRTFALSETEIHDLYAALCAIRKTSEVQDELEQAREWLLRLLEDSDALQGFTLQTRPDQEDALRELRKCGQFTDLHGRAISKNPEAPWPRRPIYLVDRVSGHLWIRAGEAATYLRHVLGVRIAATRLRDRWKEIGVDRNYFDPWKRSVPQRPRYHLYEVSKEAAG